MVHAAVWQLGAAWHFVRCCVAAVCVLCGIAHAAVWVQGGIMDAAV